MAILVFNAGSSTLKFGVFDEQTLECRASGAVEEMPTDRVFEHLLQNHSLSSLKEITAVGHRVVHGGDRFRTPTLISRDVVTQIERLSPLCPLHNPPALRMLESARRALPGIAQVAVFDTAFFATLPAHRTIYPLPYEWNAEWGIRRFGFHGISHAYCAERAAEMLGRSPSSFGVIVCHLGSGCSAAAVQNGKPVATTMGFTPLEGLMMATRSGSIDPGIIFYLMREKGLTVDELEDALHHRSGLLGVSGVSGDVREVVKAAKDNDTRSQLALALYADSVRSAIGALAVHMDRLDAIVFTAGVGENSARIREDIGGGLRSLGVVLDPDKNASAQPDADIAAPNSSARLLVIHTREEEMIARAVQKELQTRGGGSEGKL